MAGKCEKSISLLLLLLCGVVIGSFLGYLTRDISWLSWLDYGKDFGIGQSDGSGAVVLNLGAIILTFGLNIKITVGSIIGVLLAVLIYKRI